MGGKCLLHLSPAFETVHYYGPDKTRPNYGQRTGVHDLNPSEGRVSKTFHD